MPVGTADPSVSRSIAQVQQVLAAAPGIEFSMHAYGTTLEGEWDDVMHAIRAAHERIHAAGVPRIATDIRVGTRTDKQQSAQDKVDVVQAILRHS